MYCQFSPDSEPKCAYVGEIANKWGYARRQRQKKMAFLVHFLKVTFFAIFSALLSPSFFSWSDKYCYFYAKTPS